MVQLTKRDPDWYEVEGFDGLRLRLKPYGLMAGIAGIGEYEPDADYTNAERGKILAEGLIAELCELLIEWEGVLDEKGEPVSVSQLATRSLICDIPGTYVPIRTLVDQHRQKWEEEGNVSKRRSRGRRKAASTTARPVAKRRRRARKESPELTGNGALSSSTGRGP